MVGCATPPFSRSALVTTLGTSHFAITQLSSHPAPALPQALPSSSPSREPGIDTVRCNTSGGGCERKPNHYVMGPFAVGSLPVAAGCSGSPSSVVRLRIHRRAFPAWPGGWGRGPEGMQRRGGGSYRAVRQPGRVRTEAARTHSKTQKARRRGVASKYDVRCTMPGLATCSTGGSLCCSRLLELSGPSASPTAIPSGDICICILRSVSSSSLLATVGRRTGP